jgi:N6-adenosine-specific RNA methylase IME4
VKYRTIVVDPPWQYKDLLGYHPGDNFGGRGAGRRGATQFYTGEKAKTPRAAAANYDTLTCDEIEKLPIGGWGDADAHLYLWTTNAFMEVAHRLARTWDFQTKTILTWVKPQIGMGNYFRNNTEHVLFCVRGKLKTLRKDCPTAFTANRGRHSEKPGVFYDIAESMSPGPRLDVFARKLRFNWDAWGLEVGAPDGLPTPQEVAAATKEGA